MIIYLSTFLPKSKKDFYAQKMHNYNFNSADAFSYSVFCGLADNLGKQLHVINTPPLGAFPRFNSLLYSYRHTEIDKGINIMTIPNSNLYIYQYYSIYTNILSELKQYKNITPAVFLVYGVNVPIIKAAMQYRRTYSPSSKIVLIIPDFIEDCMAKTFRSKVKMALIGDINDIYKEIDGFVFLTELMNEKVKTTKPYCIVEGIYNSHEDRVYIEKATSNERTIFYSGMLYEKFGVKNLIDAFCQIEDPNLRLQLCGCGELDEYIENKSKDDPRIQYLGLLPREEVLKLQSNAFLLVNPRTPEGEFTKYSFPSKNIEYLVSGTPTLIYQLPGIPSEYYDYCFSLDSEHIGVNHLKEKIIEVLSMPRDEIIKMAKQARNFILNNKNASYQAKKIIDLINSLS